MNWLNSSLSEDGVTAGALAGGGVGARDSTGIRVGVPLPLVGAVPASLSLPVRGGFQQGLRQAGGLTITLAG